MSRGCRRPRYKPIAHHHDRLHHHKRWLEAAQNIQTFDHCLESIANQCNDFLSTKARRCPSLKHTLVICKRNHAFVYKQSLLLDFNYGNRRYVDRIIDTLIEQLLLRGTGPGQWGVLEDGRVPALGWWRPPPAASHLFWLMISRESQGSNQDLDQLIDSAGNLLYEIKLIS